MAVFNPYADHDLSLMMLVYRKTDIFCHKIFKKFLTDTKGAYYSFNLEKELEIFRGRQIFKGPVSTTGVFCEFHL